jgi:3-methyladenine DNA glycosylase/8-oxoguanine DNA glycosylase
LLLRKCDTITISDQENYDPELVLGTYNFNFYFDGKTAFLVDRPDGREDVTILKITPKNNITIRRFVCSHNLITRIKLSIGYYDNITRFIEATKGDPLLGCAYKYSGLRVRRLSPWMASIVALAQQNNSFRNAWRSLARFIVKYSDIQRIYRKEIYIPYDPGRMLCKIIGYTGFYKGPDHCLTEFYKIKARDKSIIRRNLKKISEATGLGYRVNTLLNLAYSFTTGDIATNNPDRFYRSLLEIKGFGEYSARLATLLAFGRYRLPPIDRWTIKLASAAYGVPERYDDVEAEFIYRFKRDAGLAIFFLTVLLDAETTKKALARIKKGRICPEVTDKPTPLTLWRYEL